ncbi:LysR family transcriptional regulator [Photobacterium rosenbergii]|uniref:LysR substrate-binding domain-containing protein n=1 Tax=Photobacterium rosenbergii TaxID=294936 RepID=A0ABU3ZK00_9GAMM|nr:LysR family transcriptional regulator [Photobacterium rosenbergii]MDV5170431.1 LysR substrate-binding domain-containing protein [Photobacterium rosenbergii]
MRTSTFAGLTTFAVVAKHQSLTKAAQELHLTTGALSQQIKQLEQRLDVTLFHRHSRGLTLTDSGKRLFDVVELSLGQINQVLAELKAPESSTEIRLKLTPSFAFKWLVPKLHDFNRQYPELKVQTFADGALVDHKCDDVDLVIDYCQFGRDTSGGNANGGELLLEEHLVPVMSPAYYQHFNWQSKNVWHDVTLLHDAMPWHGAQKDQEWQGWFDSMGLKLSHLPQGHYFNRTDMAMAAAEAGLGVALARQALLGKEVEQKRLISPYPAIKAQAGYFLYRQHNTTAVECFCQWLSQTIAQLHSQ